MENQFKDSGERDMTTSYVQSNIKDTQKWIQKAINSIGEIKTGVLKTTAHRGKYHASMLAPVGVRGGEKSLSGSIQETIFLKSGEARVFIRKENDPIGAINEFGMPEPKFLTFAEFPALKEWAERKLGMNTEKVHGMWIGNPETTYLGTTNVFWLPAFEQLERDVPQIVENEVYKALSKLR